MPCVRLQSLVKYRSGWLAASSYANELPFQSTSKLEDLKERVGQDRAVNNEKRFITKTRLEKVNSSIRLYTSDLVLIDLALILNVFSKPGTCFSVDIEHFGCT